MLFDSESTNSLVKKRWIDQRIFHWILLGVLVVVTGSCGRNYEEHRLVVTATAYNSSKNQTLGNPRVAAWGDTLRPGQKAIAVSRDLLDSGLTYGTRVNIEGLPGEYMVTDKMHRRWIKKIDIYMGNDTDKAREWGRKIVVITWKTPVNRTEKNDFDR